MKHFIPAFLWAVVIFLLSAGPGVSLPESWWDIMSPDKLGHAFVYGILCFLILFGITKTRLSNSLKTSDLYWSFSIAALYGIAMEIMQYCFFPNRYFENLDIIANIFGASIGMIIFKRIF